MPSGEFPGVLVVRMAGFHCHGPGSVLGQGTEILQAEQHGPKKRTENNTPSEYDGEARLGGTGLD